MVTTQELRRRILKDIGAKPHHAPYFLPPREPYYESQYDFPKTPLMLYIEAKYGIKLKEDIYRGSINDLCSRYHWEIDRSTISRWRKYIRRYLIKIPYRDNKKQYTLPKEVV